MRCPLCDTPEISYLPANDVPDVGLYSCPECPFQTEAPADRQREIASPTAQQVAA